mgnify:CR=1 FL=1
MREEISPQKNPHIQEAYEHFKAAHRSMHQGIEELLPKGYVEKRRAARKEVLLGLRKFLDAAIERVEKKS